MDNWESILNKYGWPVLILAALYLIVRYAVWPRVVIYLDDARQAQLDARQQLMDRAKRLEELQDGMMQDFKATLEKAGDRADKQIELLVEILDTVKKT